MVQRERKKRVSATVIYKDYQIYNLTINCSGEQTTLVNYLLNNDVQPYKHIDFNDMYRDVLNVIKINGFFVPRKKDFGCYWYDIQWINLDNPIIISKHGIGGG